MARQSRRARSRRRPRPRSRRRPRPQRPRRRRAPRRAVPRAAASPALTAARRGGAMRRRPGSLGARAASGAVICAACGCVTRHVSASTRASPGRVRGRCSKPMGVSRRLRRIFVVEEPAAGLLDCAGSLLWRGGREAYFCFRTMKAHDSNCRDWHPLLAGHHSGARHTASMELHFR